jgi:hypothetical protein
MATPETRSVELGPLAPSFDGDPNAVESEASQVVEPDTRELSAYGFDSDDKTLTGIGTSGAADPSAVGHVDSSDPTLVGIGPIECAKPTEWASHSQQVEPAPECVPHSEPPGPFIAEGDIEGAQDRLPKQKGTPSLLALSTALLAAAAVALARGGVPHSTAPHLLSATSFAPMSSGNAPRARYVQFETAAATSADTTSVEIPKTQAPQPATATATATAAQRETQSALAPRRATTKSAGREPLGVLDVTANPTTALVLDGRPLGKAPRVVELPSGPHTVLFVDAERGRMSVTVNVRPGQTTSASADF